MKNVIHDWGDGRACETLVNCRRAVPPDGVLLLVEWGLSNANLPSTGKLTDLVMRVLTAERNTPPRNTVNFWPKRVSGSIRSSQLRSNSQSSRPFQLK